MTNVITIDDIMRLREQLDMANVPTEGRVVQMSKDTLRDWCNATGLKFEDVKYKDLGHNIVEIGA